MFTSINTYAVRRTLLAVAALTAGASFGSPVLGANGTFLFDSPGDLGTSELTAWKAVKEFKVDKVTNGGFDIGRLDFTYDTWDGKVTADNTPTWGAGIGGGFFQTADAEIKPVAGFSVKWIQTVSPDVAGASNVWKGANGSEYPDTGGSITSPLYPHHTLPGGINPAPAAPTMPFQDFPNRFTLKDGDNKDIVNKWRAELALVGVNETDKEVRIIGSFYWGFDVKAGGGVEQSQPRLWTTYASSSFLDTFRNAFCGNDGAGLNGVKGTLWTFNDKAVFVPTPGAISLLVLAAGLIARRRRAAA